MAIATASVNQQQFLQEGQGQRPARSDRRQQQRRQHGGQSGPASPEQNESADAPAAGDAGVLAS